MSKLSDVAIRVNKKEKFKIKYEEKTFSIFEFIEKYFNNDLCTVNSVVLFDGREYFDYVMYEVHWYANDPLVKIILNIADDPNIELCTLEIIDSKNVCSTGDIDDMGLYYFKKNDECINFN